ncbi:MAG: hypothetical protein GX756_00575 [Clostridiales bacterium]|nr:hypothetical protein [Clostridiales bacterium]
MAKQKKVTLLIGNIIWISLVGIIALFALITGFIKTDAAPMLDKPYSIQIISQGGFGSTATSTVELVEGASNQEDLDKFYKTYLDSIDFSILRGIMENQWFKKAHLSTYTDEDGNERPKILDATAIRSIRAVPSSVENGYKHLVVFRYFDAKKTAKIDDVEITYDTVYFLVRHTQNEIASFKMYLVAQEALENEDFYQTYEITAYAQLTKMYDLIRDILDK